MATSMLEGAGKTPTLVIGGFVLAICYYLGLYFKLYKERRKTILQYGCKPPARFPVWDRLLGLDVIYNAIRAQNRKTFLRELQSHYEAYGNTHSSRLTTYRVLNTIEPENIKIVLSTNFKDFVVGAPRRIAFGPIIAKSIFVADGVEWEHSRALLKPSFTRSQVSDLGTLEVHVENLIRAIPPDGSTVDLAQLFLRYTADLTTDFMFGESILSLPRPEAFGGDLTKAFRHAIVISERRFWLGIFAHMVPQRAFYRSVRKLHAFTDAHVDKALEQRRAQKELGGDGTSDTGRFIFLKELARVTDDRLLLRDQLLAIFLAGRDTTAALLSNLFFVLAREVEVWKQLREEIYPLNGRKPTLDELKGLKYLGFCLNETLRLYPIVPGLSRIANNDVVLPKGGGDDGECSTLVAKGTLVVFSLFALHKRKDIWGPDAEEFRPERWQDEKASWNFLPFGGGPRNCIGQQFALTEASYTAVRLIQEFSSIESRDPRPWAESVGGTCTSANGVKVAMIPR